MMKEKQSTDKANAGFGTTGLNSNQGTHEVARTFTNGGEFKPAVSKPPKDTGTK